MLRCTRCSRKKMITCDESYCAMSFEKWEIERRNIVLSTRISTRPLLRDASENRYIQFQEFLLLVGGKSVEKNFRIIKPSNVNKALLKEISEFTKEVFSVVSSPIRWKRRISAKHVFVLLFHRNCWVIFEIS